MYQQIFQEPVYMESILWTHLNAKKSIKTADRKGDKEEQNPEIRNNFATPGPQVLQSQKPVLHRDRDTLPTRYFGRQTLQIVPAPHCSFLPS
jgi:hypothetical protein